MLLSLPSRCWDYKLEPLCPTFYMGSEDPRLDSHAYKASTLLMERSRQPPTSLTVYLPCPITAPKSSLALVLFSELFQPLGSSDTEQVDLWLLLVTHSKHCPSLSPECKPAVHPVWGLGSELGDGQMGLMSPQSPVWTDRFPEVW